MCCYDAGYMNYFRDISQRNIRIGKWTGLKNSFYSPGITTNNKNNILSKTKQNILLDNNIVNK